ncbi:MAG: LysM peptidoglycan-binding domain-containing protein [Planctomycetota bacterium]
MKIGLVLGLMLAVASVIWLATRPNFRPGAEMRQLQDTDSRRQSAEEPAGPVSSMIPAPDSVAGQNNSPGTFSFKISNNTAGAGGNEISNPPDSTIYEEAEKIKPQKFHIVMKGQTLSAISQKYYGSAGKWKKILDANQKILKDPNKLIPGTKLIIPD